VAVHASARSKSLPRGNPHGDAPPLLGRRSSSKDWIWIDASTKASVRRLGQSDLSHHHRPCSQDYHAPGESGKVWIAGPADGELPSNRALGRLAPGGTQPITPVR